MLTNPLQPGRADEAKPLSAACESSKALIVSIILSRHEHSIEPRRYTRSHARISLPRAMACKMRGTESGTGSASVARMQ